MVNSGSLIGERMPESLLKYAAKKTLFAVLVFMLMLTLIFFLMRILPGDPISTMWPPDTPPEQIQELKHAFGLDKPLPVQFVDYLSSILRGDFGKSYVTGMPVLFYVGSRYTITIELMLGAFFLSVIIGIPLGVVSALKYGTITDHAIKIVQLATWAIPSFWLAQMLQMTFAVQLGWLPVFGRMPPTMSLNVITGFMTLDSILRLNPQALFASIQYLVLPSLSLAAFSSARLCRVSRAEMLNSMSEDYITTARAKGLKELVVVYKHAFRNALIPTVTVMSLNIAGLMGGAVLVEQVFALPGLGSLLIQSVLNRDFNVIQGVVIIFTVVVVVINTVTDILYRVLDPRVKF